MGGGGRPRSRPWVSFCLSFFLAAACAALSTTQAAAQNRSGPPLPNKPQLGSVGERTNTNTIAVIGGGLLLLLATAPGALADVFTPESGGSPNADEIDSLYKITLYVGIVMFLIVEGALVWTLVRYRARRGGDQPEQIRGNTPLELGWTVGAAVILLVLTVITFVYLGRISDPPDSDPDGLGGGNQFAAIGQPVSPIRISLFGNATAIRLRMSST